MNEQRESQVPLSQATATMWALDAVAEAWAPRRRAATPRAHRVLAWLRRLRDGRGPASVAPGRVTRVTHGTTAR